MEYSLYIHIPFCKRRCHYCDFTTYAGMEDFIDEYMESLIRELRIVITPHIGLEVHSIYFGGGTPSLIPTIWYKKLIKAIVGLVKLTDEPEITLETNPGTLSLSYLKELRWAGINRLSMGVQSTDTFDLQRLDRIHTVNDVLSSYRDARTAGFLNINLDLIFALPWQNLTGWQYSLNRVIALKPEHFSLYSLIIEPGTPLYRWHQRGWIAPQDQDLEADMYEFAMAALDEAGYEHYEISNWAKVDPTDRFQSRHNKQYWLNLPYFGFGAGAHGYVNGIRTVNTPRIPDYIERMKQSKGMELDFPLSPATVSSKMMDGRTQMQDAMMLGLRLVRDGVCAEVFKARYGRSMKEVFGKEIDQLGNQGLIEWVGETKKRLRLTHRGILLANRVFREFV